MLLVNCGFDLGKIFVIHLITLCTLFLFFPLFQVIVQYLLICISAFDGSFCNWPCTAYLNVRKRSKKEHWYQYVQVLYK
jgi:hypothetical protein